MLLERMNTFVNELNEEICLPFPGIHTLPKKSLPRTFLPNSSIKLAHKRDAHTKQLNMNEKHELFGQILLAVVMDDEASFRHPTVIKLDEQGM